MDILVYMFVVDVYDLMLVGVLYVYQLFCKLKQELKMGVFKLLVKLFKFYFVDWYIFFIGFQYILG